MSKQKELNLTLPWPPSANRYWRYNRGRVHRSKEAVNYINLVATFKRGRQSTFGSDKVQVFMRFYPPDHRKRDVDNMAKIPNDALKAAGYFDDDSQIIDCLLQKRLPSKDNPRIEVRVRQWKSRKLN